MTYEIRTTTPYCDNLYVSSIKMKYSDQREIELDDYAAPKYDPPRPFLNSSVLVGSGVYEVVVDGSISIGPFFATRGYAAKTDRTRGKFLRLLPPLWVRSPVAVSRVCRQSSLVFSHGSPSAIASL
ncbi:hypothetical protein SDJN03_30110, partial [Cucurbita argyrosperma subsp. sororia]